MSGRIRSTYRPLNPQWHTVPDKDWDFEECPPLAVYSTTKKKLPIANIVRIKFGEYSFLSFESTAKDVSRSLPPGVNCLVFKVAYPFQEPPLKLQTPR